MNFEERIRKIEMMVRVSTDEADKGKRVLIYRGITETVADDGGILRVDGVDWSRMDGNASVQWNHGILKANDIATVGRIERRVLERNDKAWDFHVEYVPEGVSRLADQAYKMGAGGFLVACSIRFKVLEFEDVTEKQRTELGLPPGGWIGKRFMPVELSIVDVGSDPKSLQRMIDDRSSEPEATAPAEPTDHTALIRALNQNTAEMHALRNELRTDGSNEQSTETVSGEQPNDMRASDEVNDDEKKILEVIRSMRSQA